MSGGFWLKHQHYETYKYSWKNLKTSMPYSSSLIEDYTMRKTENWKKVKLEDSMDKINLFFGTLPSNPWAMLVT
jgi:hypothetical protein